MSLRSFSKEACRYSAGIGESDTGHWFRLKEFKEEAGEKKGHETFGLRTLGTRGWG